MPFPPLGSLYERSGPRPDIAWAVSPAPAASQLNRQSNYVTDTISRARFRALLLRLAPSVL